MIDKKVPVELIKHNGGSYILRRGYSDDPMDNRVLDAYTGRWIERMITDDYTVFDADTETKFDTDANGIIEQISRHKDRGYFQPLKEIVEVVEQKRGAENG